MAKINKIINVKVEGVGKIKQLEESLKKLRKQQRDIKKDMKDGANAGKHAEQQYKKNENAIKGQSKALRETKKAMLDANNTTKKATSLQNSMAMGVIKGAAAFSILVTAFRRVSQALTTLIGTFTEFEFVMAKVRAVSGANVEEFKRLSESAQELGRSTFFTASEVANLQLNLSKLGFTTDEILAATKATINLSIATGSDLARSATVAGNAIRGFQLDASEAGRVVDVMAVAFTSSALDIEKWQTSMTKVAPIAAMAGFSIEETTAIMAKLSDTGIEASIAGTSLRNIFLKMQDPTSELTRRVGHTISSMDSMLEVFKDMQDGGVNLANVLTFMDVRQVAAFGTMLRGADDIKALVEELENADGAGQRMADTVGDTLQGSIFKVKSALQGLSISLVKNFGKSLQKVLESFAKWLNEVVESDGKIRKLWLQIKTATRFIAALVIGVKPAQVAITAMGASATGSGLAMTGLAGATALVSGALRTLKLAIASTGIGLLVIALGEWALSLMGLNEQTYEFLSLQEQVDERMVDTNVEIEMVNQSLLSLIDAKTTLNRLTDKEGKLIDKSSVATLEYKDAKAKEKRALKDMNTVRKQYGLTLLTEKDLISDLKTETEDLMKLMQDKALADIYMQMEREAIREVVTAKTIRKELQPFIDEMSEWEDSGDERDSWKQIISKYIKTAGQESLDLRMPSYIHEQSDWLAGIFGDGTPEAMIEKQEASLAKDTNVGVIGLSKLLQKYEMTFADFIEILDPGRVSGVDYMSYLNDYRTPAGNQYYEPFKDGLPVSGRSGSADKYIERQRNDLKTILESTSQTSLAELLSGNYGKEEKEEKEETDAINTLQTFMTKAKQIVQSAILDEEISKSIYDGVIIGKEDYQEKLLEGQLTAIDSFIEQYDEKDREHNQDVINAQAKRIDIQLKLEEEYLIKKDKLLEQQYTTDKLALDAAYANDEITDIQHKEFKLKLEAMYLNRKAELYVGHGDILNGINNDIAENDIKTTEQLMDSMNSYIGKIGELGGHMTDLAGEEEKLAGLRKAGIIITKVAAAAESILAISTTIKTLATKKSNIEDAITVSMTPAIIASDTAKTTSTVALTGAKFLEAIADGIKGMPWWAQLLGIVAIVAMIKKVKSSISSAFQTPDSGGGGGTDNEGGMMSLMTFGGRHQTVGEIDGYAKGGMVYGNSHAQGGEKFAVGGRVVELEGGEAVINKRSTSMFRSQLSAMNYAGGGVSFADGGVTNIPSFAKTQFDVAGQQGLQGAMSQRSKVVVVEADITQSQNTVSAIESEAAF